MTDKPKLTPEKFWLKVKDIYNLHHDRYHRAVLTDEEHLSDISEFLTDMDALASEWYNREY